MMQRDVPSIGGHLLRKVLLGLITDRLRVTWLTLVLCMAGIIIYAQTPMELLPRSKSEQYLVAVLNPGNPTSMDAKKIDRIIRDKSTQITNVENVYTEISSLVMLSRVASSTAPNNFTDLLRTAIAKEFAENGIHRPFRVTALGQESASAVDLVISSKTNTAGSEDAAIQRKLVPALEQVRGVARVELQGIQSEDVVLQPKPGTLLGSGESEISVMQRISQALQPPALLSPTTYGSLLMARQPNAQSIGEFVIPIKQERKLPVRVSDLYEVLPKSLSNAPVVLSDSKVAVLVMIYATNGADLLAMSSEVKNVISKFNSRQENLQAKIVADASNYIAAAQQNVGENLKWGVILTCLCILLFARNLRYTAITAISIPVSLALTFPFFELFSISRNVMSLAGITLSVGVVVDATITVIDGIDDAMKSGAACADAALKSAMENFWPVAMTSLTTLAVFLPILFLKGTVGALFFDLSLTVMISQTIAFLVAIFVVPAITTIIYTALNVRLENSVENDPSNNVWSRFFAIVVKKTLSNKLIYWFAGVASIALAIGSALIAPPTEFLPRRISNEFRAIIPEASNQGNRNHFAKALDAALVKMGSSNRLVVIDESGLRADFTIPNSKEFSQRAMEEFLNTSAKPYRVIVSNKNPIDVEATNSQDLELFIPTNSKNRQAFKTSLEQLPGVANARFSYENTASQSVIDADGPRLLALPSTPGSTWNMLNFAFGETLIGAEVPSHEHNRDHQPRLIWHLSGVSHAKTHPAIHGVIPEKRDFALTSMEKEPRTSVLVNGEDMESIVIKLRGKTVSEMSSELTQLAKSKNISVTWGIGKSNADESVRGLAICFSIAAMAIVVILLSQNRSMTVTVVIMCTFIWGLIGSFPGLLIHGETLNASAIVGFILLAGTIVNNGILLMELIVRSRKEQIAPSLSCLDAVSHRTVPVLITALTTAVGMIPMVWDTGEGSQMYRALSIVVVYGTVVSTPVSLIGIPSIFMMLYDVREFLEKVRLKLLIHFLSKPLQNSGESP